MERQTPMNESMEITNEIKAKVFAQYLGQSCRTFNPLVENILNGKLMQVDLPEYLVVRNEEDLTYHNQTVNGVKLLLKPLSAISDEDAIEVMRIINPTVTESEISSSLKYKSTFVQAFTVDDDEIDIEEVSVVKINMTFQFLQSRGYDLPNYLLGGKTLHECNLCIYE